MSKTLLEFINSEDGHGVGEVTEFVLLTNRGSVVHNVSVVECGAMLGLLAENILDKASADNVIKTPDDVTKLIKPLKIGIDLAASDYKKNLNGADNNDMGAVLKEAILEFAKALNKQMEAK